LKPRLIGDENTSHHLVSACRKLETDFPLLHLADWQGGAFLGAKDSPLLQTLLAHKLVLVGFDRRTLAFHAGALTREGLGHAGVILFRRSIPQSDYGQQARLLVEFWRAASDWDWQDLIVYLPTS
jgi:hypothetical protein